MIGFGPEGRLDRTTQVLMWAKYDDCVGDVIDAGRAAELRSALEGFETLDRIADLMEIMRWQP